MDCVRCLEPFQIPVQLTFSEMFVPTIEVVTGQVLPRNEEDDVFPIDAHHHLDLAEPIRQQIAPASVPSVARIATPIPARARQKKTFAGPP